MSNTCNQAQYLYAVSTTAFPNLAIEERFSGWAEYRGCRYSIRLLDSLTQCLASLHDRPCKQLRLLERQTTRCQDKHSYYWPDDEADVPITTMPQKDRAHLDRAVKIWKGSDCRRAVDSIAGNDARLHDVGNAVGSVLGTPLTEIVNYRDTGMRPIALEALADINDPPTSQMTGTCKWLLAELAASVLLHRARAAINSCCHEKLEETYFPYLSTRDYIDEFGETCSEYAINDAGLKYYKCLAACNYWRERTWEAHLRLMDIFAEADGFAEGVSQSDNAPPSGIRSDGTAVKPSKGAKKKGGRPRISGGEEQHRIEICLAWDRAKNAHVPKSKFCKDKDIKESELTKYLDWHKTRETRKKKNKDKP